MGMFTNTSGRGAASRRAWLPLLALAVALGCAEPASSPADSGGVPPESDTITDGGGGDAGGGVDSVVDDGVNDPEIDAGSDDAAELQDGDGGDTAGDDGGSDAGESTDAVGLDSDTAGSDAAADATDGGEDAGPGCPGGLGCACEQNDACDDGVCLAAQDGVKRCSKLCADAKDCAPGACAEVEGKAGKVKACVDPTAAWCAPCAADADCQVPGATGAACVDRGAAGGYCGVACEADADCPAGSTCQSGKSLSGADLKQCLPQGGAACACSGWAKAEKAATLCYASGLPGCKAEISCGAEGLSACAPAKAGAETCNGKDDDCDGVLDNGAACDDSNPCTTDACQQGTCVSAPLATTATCDDGDACTAGDACQGGKCAPGAPLLCDDANPCTADACDGKKGCVNLPQKATCDDADACSVDDACQEGACKGAAKTCDDSNPCTSDSCDKAKGCVNLPGGVTCTDGDACTDLDACKDGKCVGSAKVCTDNNPCTLDSCDKQKGCTYLAHFGACDDGDVCTKAEACKGAKCQGAQPKCDDGQVCTKDACDAKSGACSALPVAVTTTCDDGDACTTGDLCKNGKCAATPKECTAQACAKATCLEGKCAELPDSCDDKDPCTADICDPLFGCGNLAISGCGAKPMALPYHEAFVCGSQSSKLWKIAGDQASPTWAIDKEPSSPAPKDGNCTLNFNNGKDFVCPQGATFVAGTATSPQIDLSKAIKPSLTMQLAGTWEIGGSFDKFDVGVSVDGGKTFQYFSAVDGPGGSTWQIVSASLAAYAGQVVTVSLRFVTKDCISNTGSGPFIDAIEIVDLASCSVDAQCHDGNACTADTCDAKAGTCKTEPQKGKVCDDGNFCSANDACDATGACNGVAAVCDDGNACTGDSCDAKTGKCGFAAKTAACDDGNKCTVQDTCNQGVCLPTKALACNDDNICTTDACDGKTGLCAFSAVAGCVLPCKGAGDCGDGDPCTIDACGADGKCGNTKAADGAVCGGAAVCGKGVCGQAVKAGVVQLAAGSDAYHACVRSLDGGVSCWGYNNHGQLGDGTKTNASKPVAVKDLPKVIDVATGYYHTCAVAVGGKVYCWGNNLYGQFGDGTTTSSAVPVLVPGLENAAQLSLGYYHSCALKVDGGVACWGYNTDGQLGIGNTVNSGSPVKVEGLDGVVRIALGYNHSVALRKDGTVWAWGLNTNYETASGGTADVLSPNLRAELGLVSDIAAGYQHTCAIDKAGQVICVGDNSQGQRGDGAKTATDTDKATFAKAIVGAAVLSAGYQHNLVLMPTGKAWAFGDNLNGQLGVGTTEVSDVPRLLGKLSNLIAVAAGRNFSCVLRQDGTVWCTGSNTYGQLGNGTTTAQSWPVRVDLAPCKAAGECSDDDVCSVESCTDGVCSAVAAKEGLVCDDGDPCTVGDACGAASNCVAKPKNCDDGDACTMSPVCEAGVCKQLDKASCNDGSDCTVDACDPKSGACTYTAVPGCKIACKADVDCADQDPCTVEACKDGFCAVAPGNDAQLCKAQSSCSKGECKPLQLAGSYTQIASQSTAYHTCAVRTDAKAVCWGYNNYSQIGDATTTVAKVPVEVKDLPDVVSIATGYAHTCAIDKSAKVWCWGYNTYSQIGDGTTTTVKKPFDTGIGDAAALALGYAHTCVLKKDGGLWCWGYNSDGQVGVNSTTTQKTPALVLGGVKRASAGYYHTLAVRLDESVWGWGQNTNFAVADGPSTNDVLKPTKRAVPHGVVDVGCSGYASYFVYGDGKVRSVGRNTDGELGNGKASTTVSADLSVVAASGPFVAVTGGFYHAAVLRSDGKVLAFGVNTNGELGTTTAAPVPTPTLMPYLTDVVAIAAGRYHTCALRKDGAIFCTGDALYGQIGNNSTTDSKQVVHVEDGKCSGDGQCNSSNKCVTGKCDAQSGNCTLSSAAKDAGCDDDNACTVTDVCNGTGSCLGVAKDCDDGDACTLAPQCALGICSQTAKVDCDDGDLCTADSCDSKTGACAKKPIADCKVPCAADGDCNDGKPCTTDTCVDKVCVSKPGPDGAVCGSAATCSAGACVAATKGWAVRLASMGHAYHMCALLSDKTASCWGRNNYGQIGDGGTTNALSPTPVAGLTDLGGVAIGYSHTCARTTAGEVACWGYNSDGQLGNGKTGITAVTKPETIADFGDVVDLSLGYAFSCALKKDGTVWCWGQNSSGQMGSGATSGTDVTKPQQVVGLTGVIAIEAGYNWACARHANLSISCWGSNAYKQIDGATTTIQPKPVLHPDVKLARDLSIGSYHGCYTNIFSIGRCFGYNIEGQCGTGDTVTPQASPVSLAAWGTLAEVVGGYYHSLALRSDGTALAVGDNLYGQLGNGSTTDSLKPAAMTNGTGLIQVATAYHVSCGLKSTGAVVCTGYNVYGAVGDGTTKNRTVLTAVDVGGCGNGVCQGSETLATCPADCQVAGPCKVDGNCKSGEVCLQGVCKAKAADSCVGLCGIYTSGNACQCDSSCGSYGDCCSDYPAVCGE